MLWYLLGVVFMGAVFAYLWEDPEGRKAMLQATRSRSPERIVIICAVLCALWPLTLLIALGDFILRTWRKL
jgi:hypothetical protein